MNRARYYNTRKVGAIPATIALIGFYMAGVSYAQHSHTMPRSTPQPTKQTPSLKVEPGLQAVYSQQLPALQEAVGRAIQHLEAGHHQEALNEMRQVQRSLVALHRALGQQVGPRFLNNRCPIMGTKIDPDNVPAELTRVSGQGKVAFCCGGCPAQWDRLTEPQKTAKLREVAGRPHQTPQGMPRQP